MKTTIPSAEETRHNLASLRTAPMRPNLWSDGPPRPEAERRAERPLRFWVLTLFAASALILVGASVADSRSGGNIVVTAETYDAGGAPNGGGSVVNTGSVGGAGGQSTGAGVTIASGYPAQLPGPTPPTAATLLSFSARWIGPARVALEWQTGVEFDLLGFYLERQRSDGNWERVSPSLIPTASDGFPHRYDVTDANVPEGGQPRYRLLEMDLFGHQRAPEETVAQVGLRTAIDRTTKGLTITVQGRSGPAVVETATDVAQDSWLPVGELTLDADGRAVLAVPQIEDVSTRFYRVRQE